jgi:hypothetical protein
VFELDSIPGPFDVDIALADILFMVAGVIFYGGLTLWLERLFSGTRYVRICCNITSATKVQQVKSYTCSVLHSFNAAITYIFLLLLRALRVMTVTVSVTL